MNEVTRIINAIQHGDKHATEELLPLVYEELRLLAAQKMSQEKPGHTLQATALVHEAYIRLLGGDNQGWDGEGHFFAAAAEAMRRILVESARRKISLKRGGGRKRVSLNDELLSDAFGIPVDELIALDEALKEYVEEDPSKAEIVKLWYFGGLNINQSAKALGISRASAYRQLSFARAWLYDRMNGQK